MSTWDRWDIPILDETLFMSDYVWWNLSWLHSLDQLKRIEYNFAVDHGSVRFSMFYGGVVGLGVAALPATVSIFSKHVRCICFLVPPSIFAKRGRSVLLSLAAGLLLTGPVNTIRENILGITNAITCMYQQVKSIADQYVEEYNKVRFDIYYPHELCYKSSTVTY